VGKNRSPGLDAVLFDFDGTLARPAIDFPGLKRELGAPPGMFALEYVRSLPSGDELDRAEDVLARFEMEAADRAEPNDGAEDAVRCLKEMGLLVGIVTRSRLEIIERSLRGFPRLSLADFDVIVTRDDDVKVKPEPDQILLAASRLNVRPERTMMVGDFVVDVEAGHRAGAITVHLLDPNDSAVPDHEPDFLISSLVELGDIVRMRLET
jgi:HAD superfamily hydrolase (TIGR01662 family)